MNNIHNDLNYILNKGNGMALIVSMVECPKCAKDIWLEMGSHCGFDANLDFAIDNYCYECFEPIKCVFDINDIKDTGFITISDYGSFTSNNFITNKSKL
jgi:hypothetical protein